MPSTPNPALTLMAVPYPTPPLTTSPHLVPALQHSAFTVLARFINNTPRHAEPPQFEIIPSGTASIAADGTGGGGRDGLGSNMYIIQENNIGMEKRFLIAAVVWGMRWRPRPPRPPHPVSSPQGGDGGEEGDGGDGGDEIQRMHDVTAIMLIYDPEIRWAVNWRMRWLLGTHTQGNEGEDGDGDGGGNKEDRRSWNVTNELRFLTGLMTSPGMDRHTKIEGGWRYRRHLITHVMKSGDSGFCNPEKSLWGGGREEFSSRWGNINCLHSLMKSELSTVRRAGEIHTRNYHAWSYARFIAAHTVLSICKILQEGVLNNSGNGDGDAESRAEDGLAEKEEEVKEVETLLWDITVGVIDTHLTHTLTHISDTSCWSFLLWLFTHWHIPFPTPTSTLTAINLRLKTRLRHHLLRVVLPQAFAFIEKYFLSPDLPTDPAQGGCEAAFIFLRTVLGAEGILWRTGGGGGEEGGEESEETEEERKRLVAELRRVGYGDGDGDGKGEERGERRTGRVHARTAYEWVLRRTGDVYSINTTSILCLQ